MSSGYASPDHADSTCEGFIVHSYARSRRGRSALYLLGRLRDGSTFAIVENRYQPNFYIREGNAADVEKALASLSNAGELPTGGAVDSVASSLRTMDGELCRQVLLSLIHI